MRRHDWAHVAVPLHPPFDRRRRERQRGLRETQTLALHRWAKENPALKTQTPFVLSLSKHEREFGVRVKTRTGDFGWFLL